MLQNLDYAANEIAACVPVWEAKRGLIYANRATEITEKLARLGFFEKTQDYTDEKEGSA